MVTRGWGLLIVKEEALELDEDWVVYLYEVTFFQNGVRSIELNFSRKEVGCFWYIEKSEK